VPLAIAAYPDRVQSGETFFTRTSVLGRLITFAAVGGVLAAALVIPVVATTGILVRNEADKFTTLSLNPQSLPQRSEILDSSGHLLAYVYGVDVPYGSSATNSKVLQYFGWDRQPVSFNQIAPAMVNAIVAIEDSRYWEHGAIDLRGTIRAAVNDIEHQPVQGGSTIAQQYVKNVLLLDAEVSRNTKAEQAAYAETLTRKLNELRMAVNVEHAQSKQDILAGYLNDAYYENNAYGIEAAAETYFDTTVQKLTTTQAATLAGIVENPSAYDPILHPANALARRNTVLARMATTGNGLTAAQAKLDEAKPLGLNVSVPESGCEASSVGTAGFFCEYVEEVFLHDPAYGATPMARAKLLSTGGLRIYTTLDQQDQKAAYNAVNFVEPDHSNYYNPGQNADTEAVVQPGTGRILALSENAPYGTGKGQTEIDYAVNTGYGGSAQGVQTGSSSKLFTLITALKQGLPFGFTLSVPGTETINGYTDCQGAPAGNYKGMPGAYNVTNAEGPKSASTQSLYTGTTQSVNVFYAQLEKKIGLCNVVQTAVSMGMTRVDGTSLLKPDGALYSADNIPSFTLGSVNVSPLSMAAAYATVAARGTYCAPVAISKIVTASGGTVSVPSAGCHRVLSSGVADAVNYILQGVLVSPGTAATVGGFPGREAAGKTGTSNVENGYGTPYAAFAGYTPSLVGYVSVFNPISPTVHDTMGGPGSCYRLEFGGLSCPGEMFGTNAPASTWHMTFDHANLGKVTDFVPVPADSLFNAKGNGQVVAQPKPPKHKGGNGGGGGGGNGGGPGPGGPPTPITPLPTTGPTPTKRGG
jgi:membrane peptidoglycan carboxypeptidase